MTDRHREREAYFRLQAERPSYFQNPSTGGIRILFDQNFVDEAEQAAVRRLSDQGLSEEKAAHLVRVGLMHENEYLYFLRDPVRFPDGSLGTYLRVVLKDNGVCPGCAILPVYRGQVVVISHFRHAFRKDLLETPRGFGFPGLKPLENAIKELREEVGAEVHTIEPLGGMVPSSGLSDEWSELFYAELKTIGEPERSDGVNKIVLMSVAEFEQKIVNSEITDSFTLTAFLKARLKGLI